MPFWTYLLHCRGGSFYIGHTDNLDMRMAQHQAGRGSAYTRERLPVELVWSQEFPSRQQAFEAERKIKGWSRAKKLALIRGDWEAVVVHARSKDSPSTSSGRADREIAASVLTLLRSETTNHHPHECCGILTGHGATITAAIPTQNTHPTPRTHFEIDPQALIDAHRAARAGGPQVLGYYHSHPDGAPRPSATDASMASGDGRIWAIVGKNDEICLWQDSEQGFVALSYAENDR